MADPEAAAELEAFTAGGEVTPGLTKCMQWVAASGETPYSWSQFKLLLGARIDAVCADYYAKNKDCDAIEPYQDVLKRIHALLTEFPNPPFTVQGLCELLLDPRRVYANSTRKCMNAIEKLLTVSSTVPVTMPMNTPKPGSYMAVAEYELSKLVAGTQGEGAQPMEVG